MPKSTNPLLRRKSSSPFTTLQRRKPISRTSSLAEKDDTTERLDDAGLIPSLAPPGVPQDVVSLIKHIHAHSFAELPERAAGMNSGRIAEVLNFRCRLPPVVSVAHLHALSKSTTGTEREIARLLAGVKIRRVSIPGRGKGGAAVGECVAPAEEWKDLVREHSALSPETKQQYTALMDAHPTSTTIPSVSLQPTQTTQLVQSGFLTSPSALSTPLSNLFAPPGHSTISTAGSKAATGTLAAIGGSGAIHESGGSGSTLFSSSAATRQTHTSTSEMTLSLPNMGLYLKLLLEARAHLLALLKKLSPRYREATRALLREKWEGNTAYDGVSRAKRARGEWGGVLPGRTQMWKRYYGLTFEWVLAECVGAGVVEIFETGSVGLGVRGT